MIIGLIRPTIFQRIIKKTISRKTIAIICSSLALVSFIGIGLTTPHTPSQPSIVNSNQLDTESASNTTTTEVTATTTESLVQEEQLPTDPTVVEVVAEPETNNILYAIVSVTDGDTFKVSIDGKTEIVRAIGIDTPETVDPRKPVQCFGVEASKRAKSLLTGKRVQLQADPTQGERDKYSRLLRYAWLEDGTFFNLKMIADGYASEFTYNTPYKYQAEFKQAETNARNAKLGLWADNACPQTQPSAVAPTPTPTPTPTPVVLPQPSDHTFYTSSYYSSTNYYCDTDDGWKTLSSKYLKSFSSESALLTAYPNRKLHEPCK